jgi:hypothetical protein
VAQSLKRSLGDLLEILVQLQNTNQLATDALNVLNQEAKAIDPKNPANLQQIEKFLDSWEKEHQPILVAHGNLVDDLLAGYGPIEQIAKRAVATDKGLRIASWFTLGVLAFVVASFLVNGLARFTSASTTLLVLSLSVSALGFVFLSVQLNSLEHGMQLAQAKLAQLQAMQADIDQIRKSSIHQR